MTTDLDAKLTVFRLGNFTLHSGERTDFKIDCDSLTDADFYSLARFIVSKLPQFSAVEGVARGGLRFAKHLSAFQQTKGQTLIVDDVLTTGKSMTAARGDRKHAVGLVIFARGICPEWVTPIFQLNGRFM